MSLILQIILSKSLSARRAWIEIYKLSAQRKLCRSLSARRAWIEISVVIIHILPFLLSLSARRAWIEIKSQS